MSEAVLAGARAGDERAFRELTEPYRRELHVHCYRLLGSLVDAEDVLQETMLAAWRGLDGLKDAAALRAWLYRIATNRCRNAVRDARRRRPPEPVPPFTPPEPTRRGEVTWLQPYPDALLAEVPDAAPGPEARYQAREAVELAFVAALQRMPPRQAATLVLRDVLGYPAAEVADMLGTTGTAVKGALQRARAALDRPSGRPDPEQGDVVRRFAEAFVADDVEGVVALLTDDAWLAMPPAPHEYQGRAAIAGFLHASAGWRPGRRHRLVATRANTQPAFGCYLADREEPVAYPAGLIVLTVADNRIRQIIRFLADDVFHRFGLPAILPDRATTSIG